ncbi:MAG: ABC transporter permease [Hyphomicrobiales bacterium]|nr:ABC transporter permease [Hyphomicrobiales bacterium]
MMTSLAPATRRLALSPINRRRLANFRANRRGWWSLWIFLFLFFGSLTANFWINDRPLLVRYQGQFYLPVFVNYPETDFGGFLPTTDYRDPFVQKEIKAKGWLIWPPIRFSWNTHKLDLPTPAPSPPTWLLSDRTCRPAALLQHKHPPPGEACNALEWNWLGTDDQARDVVARLVYGFRISVLFGLLLAGLSSVVGILAGAVQGFYGGWLDLSMQRFIEIWSSLPQLYILIIVASVITPGFFVLLGVLLLFSWVSLVHLVRAETLRARNLEYVNAARALGLSNNRILFRHVLPNAMVATITFMPFILNASIATLTALDFLGFGLPPGSASLGELLLQGKSNLQAPWLAITSFIAIALLLSLLTFIGEAVRDAFDPRKSFA